MRTPVAMILICAAACGCGGTDDESRVLVHLSSRVTPLDSALVSVFDAHGAIVIDRQIGDGGAGGGAISLPRDVEILGGTREAAVTIQAWGDVDGAHVAYGRGAAQLAVGSTDDLDLTLDAPPGDCDGDGVPDAFDGCAAIADPMQEDANADGVTDACTPGASCPGNLITNSTFDAGTTGWQSSTANPSTLAHATDGHAGPGAALVCKVANGGTREYSADDEPATVPSTTPGTRYRMDAWVRSDMPGGQTIDLRLGEFAIAGGSLDTAVEGAPATTDWKLETVTYTTSAPAGTAYLDVRFRVLSAADGSCFEVDDVCLQQLAPACP